jgi:hypothetical protein
MKSPAELLQLFKERNAESQEAAIAAIYKAGQDDSFEHSLARVSAIIAADAPLPELPTDAPAPPATDAPAAE